jgi:quinol monooxygenase YgiN
MIFGKNSVYFRPCLAVWIVALKFLQLWLNFGMSGGSNITQIMTTQMVGGLKIVQVKAGYIAEFERLFTELRSEMRKYEPGCLLYSLLKSRTRPGAYIVHEQYRNQAALDTHQKSAHGAKYFPQMRTVIEKIDVEYFNGVVG